MGFDRFLRDVQLMGDFLITGSATDLLNNFLLPRREYIYAQFIRRSEGIPRCLASVENVGWEIGTVIVDNSKNIDE